MKKRVLSLLTALCLWLALLTVTASAAEHTDHTGWTGLTSDDLATFGGTGGSYYLSGDVEAADDITITGTVTLCLNGNVLDLKRNYIEVGRGGSLTLCDCNSTGRSHKFTVGGNGLWTLEEETGTQAVQGGVITGGISQRGAVYVRSGGTFTLSGGTIVGNRVEGDGGGVYVRGTFNMSGGSIVGNLTYNSAGGGVCVKGGTFNMSGGSITGNLTYNSAGGGVCVKGGTFNMSGGSITGNEAPSYGGGGVCVFDGTFNMSGGSITDNNTAANGGGVCVSFDGTFTLSGSPTITGNTQGETTDSNVWLADGKTITIGEGGLNQATAIGVSMNTPGDFTSGWNTAMDSKNPADYFTSDLGTHGVALSGTNEATLKPWNYTVTFNSNDGTGATASQGFFQDETKVLTPNPFPRTGYTFTRWTTNPDGSGTPYLDEAELSLTENLTLYAQWELSTYTVTLDPNGGTINSGNVTSYTYNTGAHLPTDVTRSGYTFAGWYDNKSLEGTPVTAILDTDTGDKTYWAKWTANTYPVTLNPNGGTINSGDVTSYTCGTGANLPTDVTRSGYTFAGWFDNELLEGTPVTAISGTDTGGKTYWAKWTANTYTVTLNPNGGTINSGNVTSYTYNTGADLPTDVTRSGYTFAGWYDNESLEGTPVTAISGTDTGDKTYWAKWTANSGGGGGGDSTPVKTPSQQAQDKIGGAEAGDTVEITLKTGQTKLDREVFEELSGRDVTLEINLPGGVTWTVNGLDIPAEAGLSDLDLGVSMNTSAIPAEIINAVTGEVSTLQLTLRHDGGFGFTMTLTAPLGADNAGYWANLYYYNEDAGAMEFQSADRIADDGTASFPFTHASQYAIVIDSVSHEPQPEPEPLPFADVAEGAWYHEAVAYVYENGLMTGTGETAFSPDAATSRAMVATVLWRLAGSPVVNYAMDFSDVAEGQWYSEAIRWAASEKIVTGYDSGAFGTDDPITREQLAAMLWRYAQSMGYDVSVGEDTNILSYTDALTVSEYAVPALQWACGAGIITGTGDGSTLSPQGQASRAEAAAMLMRFCQSCVTP